MSAPPNEGQQPYDDQGAAQAAQQESLAAGGKKKRRGYAAGAFDVASGANAAAGGQVQGGGAQYGMPAGQPGYGGYPAEPQQPSQDYQYPQAGYGAPQQMATPQQQQQPAYGGYQAPDQGYPVPGGQPAPGQPGVAGITQGMGGMQLGAMPPQQPQQQPPPAQAVRPNALNQLYPMDVMNQPFNVSELDLPPPPIILPPNVSFHQLSVLSSLCMC
jgi:protein transport protein SEC24